MWDLSVEKLLQKYELAEKEDIHQASQITSSLELLNTKFCPTAMTSSSNGNLVFVAFSDNSLQMIDLRIQDKSGSFQVQKLIKDADTLIKSILISPDETVIYTGSTNATIQIWDVAQKELVQQLGSDKSVEVSQDFHKDSIWQI